MTAFPSPSVFAASEQFIGLSATLGDALRVIEGARAKIALVVDSEKRLVRTVTDGDIRRGLLNGLNLASCVAELSGRVPVLVDETQSTAEILATAEREEVDAIIAVGPEGIPTRIVDCRPLQPKLHMSPPHMGSAELEFVKSAFEDNWIAPAGPNLEMFEARLAEISGRKHALALSSGTAAIHLALVAQRVRPGRRVYVSDLTFAASLQPILYLGCEPVLIDSEAASFNMSPSALARRLEKDRRANQLPDAVIVVHLYGQPADIAALSAICEQFKVPLIEDAAESLGATYANAPSGSHGTSAAFSFNGNKIITTSGGGALVADDPAIISRARYLSTQGRDPVDHYQHSAVAYNYRMSNVLAGIGLGQLDLLGERVARRRQIFERYRIALGNIPGVSFQQEVANSAGNRWLSVMTLDPDVVAIHCYQLMRALRSRGIESRPGWKPMHMQPLCRGFDFEPHDDDAVVSEQLFLQSLCLPSGSSMTDAVQDDVVAQVRRILQDY